MTDAGTDLTPAAEQIFGPFHGYYFATYIMRAEDGFRGYVKICDGKPADVWDCDAFLKIAIDSRPTADRALAHADLRARASVVFLMKHGAVLSAA